MLTKEEADALERCVRRAFGEMDVRGSEFGKSQLIHIISRETETQPSKNYITQAEASRKMIIKLHCPACGYDDLKLTNTVGAIREFCCNKCQQEWTVS